LTLFVRIVEFGSQEDS
jgi:RNA recognition motif-containing protein